MLPPIWSSASNILETEKSSHSMMGDLPNSTVFNPCLLPAVQDLSQALLTQQHLQHKDNPTPCSSHFGSDGIRNLNNAKLTSLNTSANKSTANIASPPNGNWSQTSPHTTRSPVTMFNLPSTSNCNKLDELSSTDNSIKKLESVQDAMIESRSKTGSKSSGTFIPSVETLAESAMDKQTHQINGAVHNTLRKTRSDMKVIHRYLVQVKHDTREIHQIPSPELDRYIQDFVLTAKKKDGHEYEPESLKAFVHSLERHLKHHGYSHSVLKGNAFSGTRTVLNQRLNELRALSRSGISTSGLYGSSIYGNKRMSTDETNMENRTVSGNLKANSTSNAPTSADLMQAGVLGTENPQAILNSLWLMNRTQFNIGGTQRHRNLVWGQFQLVTDDNGVKAIKFTPLFESAEVRYCRGFGGTRGYANDPCSSVMAVKSQPLSCTGSAKRQPLPFNCVELFEIYANLRPLEARGVSEPFYLCPDAGWEHGSSWFKTNAAGSQLLSRVPRLLGLKPARETSQVNSTGMICPISETANLANDQHGQHLSPPYRNLNSEKSLMDLQALQQSSQYFSNSRNSLPPSLFNFLPFMFPPNTDSGAGSAYQSIFNSNLTFANPLHMVTTNQSTLPTLKTQNPKPTDPHFKITRNLLDFGHPSVSDSNYSSVNSKTEQLNPSTNSPTSTAISLDVVGHSSECSPSPADAENLSSSDTSPKLSYCPPDPRSFQNDSCNSTASSSTHNKDKMSNPNMSPDNSNQSATSSENMTSTTTNKVGNSNCEFDKVGVFETSDRDGKSTRPDLSKESKEHVESNEFIKTSSPVHWAEEILNLTQCKSKSSSFV